MLDALAIGLVIAFGPLLSLVVTRKAGTTLRRHRRAVVLAFVASVAVFVFGRLAGYLLASYYLNAAWFLLTFVVAWSLPTILRDPLRKNDWSPLVVFRVVFTVCALLLGTIIAAFGRLQHAFIREGYLSYPFLYQAWIDGGVLSREEAWVVHVHRVVPWFPIVAAEFARVSVHFKTTRPDELTVELVRVDGQEKIVVSVKGGETKELRLP